MYGVKTYEDITKIEDEKIIPFLEKYAHYIVPRKKELILDSTPDGTVKAGKYLRWKDSHFWIEGKLFGKKLWKEIMEKQAKPLLLDLGHAYDLAIAATAAGAVVTETSKTKLYADFGKIVLLFTLTPDGYYFLDLNKLYDVNSVDTIETILKNGENYLHPYYDYIVYGQSSVVYVKDSEDYKIAVKKSQKEAIIEILRTQEAPGYRSGRVVLFKKFHPDYVDAFLDLIEAEKTPYKIMKKLFILDVV